jgi:sortase (surface protein transpeptidase)
MIEFLRAHSGPRPMIVGRVLLVLALLVLAFVLRPRPASAPSHEQAVVPVSVPTTTSVGAIQTVAPPSPPTVASPPVSLAIPSIGVQTPLQSLGLLPDGTLQSPAQWGVAGWYDGGIVPGQIGPAVIAGHVDSTHGPAVFYRLKNLQPGETAEVTQQDGAVLTFVVDTVQSFAKDQFPTAAVYGPTPDAELRLITCTGVFDSSARSYLSNLVVTAHLAGS